MKSKNTFHIVLLTLGCTLLLASLVFFIISIIEYGRINVDTDAAVEFLESVIPERSAGIKEERTNNEMPSVTYDGQDYSAILSLSRLSVKLPIRSSWDKTAVDKVPCVFSGNTYEGTLIIGGVDSDGLFDFIPEIDIGDEVVITDMNGYEFKYIVTNVKHDKNSKASTLADEKSDLTLFAKDKRTGDWLLVRCSMK